MKIFGKRKSSSKASASDSTPGGDSAEKNANTIAAIPAKQESEEDLNVPSYFSNATESLTAGSASSKKKKQRNEATPNGDDIDVLLAMDPKDLNSKQRRLVRRHKERDGTSTEPSAEDKDKGEGNTNSDAAAKDTNSAKEGAAPKEDQQTQSNDDSTASNVNAPNITEILSKLEGMNSKDRRKYLRQLKHDSGGTIDESVIAAAQEQAKKVAERNEKEATASSADATTKDKKRKSMDSASGGNTAGDSATPSKPKKKRRKKAAVDISTLPPDERARREQQRKMQIEAVERRAAGLVDPTRHPLNSERRRANRRKPSKAALIAQAKKEAMAEKGRFNAVGYNMRRGGGGGGGGGN